MKFLKRTFTVEPPYNEPLSMKSLVYIFKKTIVVAREIVKYSEKNLVFANVLSQSIIIVIVKYCYYYHDDDDDDDDYLFIIN